MIGTRRTPAAVLAVLALLLLGAPSALAAFPEDPPDDPGYGRGTSPADCATEEVNTGQYYLFSFIPVCTPNAVDPEGAAGMSVDRAWREFTTGDPDVTVAYIESGVNWHGEHVEEIANRVFLNDGELPEPTTPRDDGQLDAADFSDTRDSNDNGVVDPEDLIVRFSDGRDDDRNGYTDDISGWDFYDDQNDPASVDRALEHANNQLKQIAAEADNGVEEVGICPRCTVLPIKGGAEALDRTDDLAEAWLYAADMGVDVIVSVTADLGYSSFMRQAVESIHDRGIVMVEASNDFNSTDHQGGHFHPHVLPGNGMVSSTRGVPGPPTNLLTRNFRARSSFTSWGTKNDLTAATKGGTTSEATPTLGGAVALLLAYGREAAREGRITRPLTGPEAVQVLRNTASDVDDPSLNWPSGPGWDLQYGYGRPNLHRAMTAVRDGDLPPVAWFDGPRWYTLYDPTRTRYVDVSGHLEAPRSSSYRWVLEYAAGGEPRDGEWRTAASGTGTGPRDGRLGRIDLRTIPQEFWSRAMERSRTRTLETNERYTLSMRLRIEDAQGRKGEERRTVAVHHDPTWARGFPRRFGPGGESQPQLADLGGRGRMAVVFGDTDGRVHALDGRTGRRLRGFPVRTNPTRVTRRHPGIRPGHEPIISNVAVGDLDHDGRQWIVATTTTGRTYVWDDRGRRRRGWPKVLRAGVERPPIPRPARPFRRDPVQGASSPPVLADLDGDRRLEILQSAWDGHLHAWNARGRRMPGFPLRVKLPDGCCTRDGYVRIEDFKLVVPPAVGDLDGDGDPEIVLRNQEALTRGVDIQPDGVSYVLAYDHRGRRLDGFPTAMSSVVIFYGSAQEFITEGANAPVLADTDGDGDDEIAASPIFSVPNLFDGDGRRLALMGALPDALRAFAEVRRDPARVLGDRDPPADEPLSFTTSGAWGRIGPQRRLVYAEPSSGAGSTAAALLVPSSGAPINNFLRVATARGGPVDGFPTEMQGLNFLGAPAIADITGDGHGDLVLGGDTSLMHGWDHTGAEARGFPKFHTGWTLWAPTVGDLDGDGRNELVSTTREGYLMAWDTPGRAAEGNQEWWSYRHDERNTGRWGTDTRPPSRPGRLRYVRRRGGRLEVRFRAPGDDWALGRATRYRIRVSAPGRRGARRRTIVATADAGRTVRVPVPRRARYVSVVAVDEAGNVSAAATRHRRGSRRRRG